VDGRALAPEDCDAGIAAEVKYLHQDEATDGAAGASAVLLSE
jgi:hypothetical protein